MTKLNVKKQKKTLLKIFMFFQHYYENLIFSKFIKVSLIHITNKA
jgi:hypothetical protein